MFYHALTGNGGTEDLEPVLLWTNNNPTADFAAQTISLDLNDYVGALVEFKNTETITSRVYVKKDDSKTSFGSGYTTTSAGVGRNISITNDGVTFGNAKDATTNSNSALIPTTIYGIKEYVVEPVGTFKITEFKGMENVDSGYGGTLILDTKDYSTLKIGTLYGKGNDGKIYITGIKNGGASSTIVQCTTTMKNLKYDISNYIKVEFHSRYTGSTTGNTSYAKNIELL